MTEHSRRRFLQAAGAGVTAAAVGIRQSAGKEDDSSPGGKEPELGLASYSLRKLNIEQVISVMNRVALKNIALKSMHLPLDSDQKKIEETVKKFNDAGIDVYGGGVIYMGKEEAVKQAFDYAKAAGMKVIIGVPKHDLLELVDKMVKEYDMKVAIHNHGPGDKQYPTPAAIWEKVKDLDGRIGMCMDIGHTKRSGADPSQAAMKYAARLHDLHVKDVTEASAKGRGLEIGRGVIDIPAFFRAVNKIGYKGIISFEFEKDPSDPLAGLAESVGYVRGVMSSLK